LPVVRCYWTVEPPSMARAAPVMNADSSLSRKVAAHDHGHEAQHQTGKDGD
jgi:hypothetical protein